MCYVLWDVCDVTDIADRVDSARTDGSNKVGIDVSSPSILYILPLSYLYDYPYQ